MTKELNPIPPRSPGLDRRMQAAMKDATALRSQYVAVWARSVRQYLQGVLRATAKSPSRPDQRAAGTVR